MKFFNNFTKVAVAVLALSLITVGSLAVNWTKTVYHPRTQVLTTAWDARLNSATPSKDGLILWVDTAKQRLSVFKNKKFVTSYQITTGKSSTPTPTGTYKINYAAFRANDGYVLKDGNGKQIARVSYWIPFIDDSIAFHNASWRQTSEFGKIQNSKTNGSNGCVNMSYSDIVDLYERIVAGTVVVVTK
jgi:lipoprotein-anchoring transpeptidase ErfK/SrfK